MSDPAYEAISKAKRQEESGNPEGAAYTLEQYLSTDPHCVAPRLELARIYVYHLKDREFGLTQLDVILELDPDNVDALKASTTVRMTDKRNRELVNSQYAHLVELVVPKGDKAEVAKVCAAYAVFLRQQMLDFEKSREMFLKAIGAMPEAYEYHQDYAVLLLNDLKDYMTAKAELEEVLRLKPNSISAKKNYDLLMKTKFDKDGNLKKQGFFARMRH